MPTEHRDDAAANASTMTKTFAEDLDASRCALSTTTRTKCETTRDAETGEPRRTCVREFVKTRTCPGRCDGRRGVGTGRLTRELALRTGHPRNSNACPKQSRTTEAGGSRRVGFHPHTRRRGVARPGR